jgi:hypothetical protein
MPDGQAQLATAFDYLAVHGRIAEALAKDWFFIGAYPKSGTTWLQRTLNEHPEICCAGEGHFFNHFGRLLESALKTHNKYIDDKNTRVFAEFEPFPHFEQHQFSYLLASAMALVLSEAPNARGARLIGEKTPDNLGFFSHLALLFPRAKFVHVIRDGRDCAVSAWFHNQRLSPDRLKQRFPTMDAFVEYIAGDWKKRVEAGLQFGATHPGRCLIVQYERMYLQPRDTLRAILGFLGADTAPDVLQNCVEESSFRKLSGGRAPGTENRASFLRQGKPGNWQQHLTPEATRTFLSVAGELMQRLGYRV